MKNNSRSSNRLINEKSPYLQQHAHNPVDWFPWGDEAFELAKELDKPIFLSIGYSTCHWCHVMEHESFEDTTVANLMNDAFISIKVDREERPDIDHVYMSVCQMMTGGGGWPLTIIMTPDKKPFFAGTYFPKESRGGRIGMVELIGKVEDVWKNSRDDVYKSANKITNYISDMNKLPVEGKLDDKILEEVFTTFARMFDTKNGGFGTAPKFPSPHNLMYLLRYYKMTGENRALEMVEETLTKMSLGGVFDHVGFGFHRYSTDPEWLLPHFEKMLYDQATISYALTETYLITKNEYYKEIAEKIFTYLENDMLAPEGYFYSAEDADSEGIEGKFYTWQTKELKTLLSEDEYNLYSKIYNISDEGNYEHEATRTKDGTNIPHLSSRLTELNENQLILLETIRTKLHRIRSERIRPLRDSKMLTDWNSMIISSLAYAARSFGNEHYLRLAKNAMTFLQENMQDNNSKLYHVYNDGRSDIPGKLDDYAFFINASIELYNSTFNADYINQAIETNQYVLDNFLDTDNGGFFLTSSKDEVLISRPKTLYDSAIPSGNSVQALNLLKLSTITADPKHSKIAEQIIDSATEQVEQNNMSFSYNLSAFIYKISAPKELIVTDGNESTDRLGLAHKLTTIYSPNTSFIYLDNKEFHKMTKIADYLSNYLIEKGETVYYLCENYNCELPEKDLEKILKKL